MKSKSAKRPNWLKQARQAMSVAVSKTLLDHKRKGFPIFIWQESKVVRIPAHRIH